MKSAQIDKRKKKSKTELWPTPNYKVREKRTIQQRIIQIRNNM